jgi:hypothetical protein
VRALTALPLVLFLAVVALACSSNSGGDNGDDGGVQPSSCESPCTPGALCYQPDPGSNCNGDWYCWSDSMWHCAPPDSGGPGDATVMFDTGYGGDDASDEEPVMTPDAEAGPGNVEAGPGDAEAGPGDAAGAGG